MGEEETENWKQFQGTELGSLLGSIYGSKPSINYPKPKVRKGSVESSPHGNFIVGAKVDAADPRKSTRRAVSIDLPTFGKQSKQPSHGPPALVDIIPKRRSETIIRAELDEIKMKQNHYRPAYRQPISSEDEKQRLSEICTYKGMIITF